MTIETTDSNGNPLFKSGPYNGTGFATTFDYDFQIQAADELLVTVKESDGTQTELTLTTDYTVSGVGNDAGGQITLTDASFAPSGSKLAITYKGDYNQETRYSNQGRLKLELLEKSIDKQMMHLRAMREELNRTLKADVFDGDEITPGTLNLPAPDTGRSIIWNASGGFDNGPTASEIESAEGFANQVVGAALTTIAFEDVFDVISQTGDTEFTLSHAPLSKVRLQLFAELADGTFKSYTLDDFTLADKVVTLTGDPIMAPGRLIARYGRTVDEVFPDYAQIGNIRDLPALLSDTTLAYDPNDEQNGIASGDYLLLADGSVFEVADQFAGDHHYTGAIAKVYEAGTNYSQMSRLQQAVDRGNTWPDGALVHVSDSDMLLRAASGASIGGTVPDGFEIVFKPQSSKLDTTAGRALINGAFGLGDEEPVTVSDMDDKSLRNGWYRTIDTTTGDFPTLEDGTAVSKFGFLLVMRYGADDLFEVYAPIKDATGYGRLFFRVGDDGAWGSWYETSRVGDAVHGLGESVGPPPVSGSLNDAPVGFSKVDTTDTDKPGPSNIAGTLMSIRWNGLNAQTQLFIAHFPSSEAGNLYTRSRQGGVWTDWAESMPMGERGSNANGEYIKFADGTMICTHVMSANSSADSSWTYPAAFNAVPAVTGAGQNGAARIFTLAPGSVGVTSADFNVFSLGGGRTAAVTYLQAVGTWF